MGQLIASLFVSIDNMMVAKNEDMSWVLGDFDPEMGADMDAEVMRSMQAILLGHTTYDIMAQHWPKMTEAESPGADLMNGTPKLVFSRTLEKAEWGSYGNATVVKEVVPAEIQRMKSQSDGSMVIMGSASLVHDSRTFASSMSTFCGSTRSSWATARSRCSRTSKTGTI
jgi:dihydrofolate reductase